MASNSKLLSTISVSFESDQVPNSCSVEINLQPNSPGNPVEENNKPQRYPNDHLRQGIVHKETDYRSDESECVEVLEGNIAAGEMDAVECHGNNSLFIQQQPPSFEESRNDDAEEKETVLSEEEEEKAAALSPMNTSAVKGIFRTNSMNSNDHHNDKIPLSPPRFKSSRNDSMTESINTQLSSSPSLIPRVRNRPLPSSSPPLTAATTTSSTLLDHTSRVGTGLVCDDQLNDGRTLYKNSSSYDGLFEVRKSQSSTQGVTLGRGSARSIYLLYDELRQISSASIAQADEALEKLDKEKSDTEATCNTFSSSSTTANTSDVDNDVKARHEMILEARKPSVAYPSVAVAKEGDEVGNDDGDSTEVKNNNNSSSSSTTTTPPTSDQNDVRIKRTQSLDRVLSTKEVLDLATLALQPTQNERNSKNTNNTRGDRMQKTNSDDSDVESSPSAFANSNKDDKEQIRNGKMESTGVQEAMLGPKAEFGNLASEDKRLRNTTNGSQSKTCRSTSEQTLLGIDILQDDNLTDPQSLPPNVPAETNPSRERALKRLDGIKDTCSVGSEEAKEEIDDGNGGDDDAGSVKETRGESLISTTVAARKGSGNVDPKETAAFSLMRFLWGGDNDEESDGHKGIALACGARRQLNEELKECWKVSLEDKFATMAMRPKHHSIEPSYPEAIASRPKADPRMQDWIDGQFATKQELPVDGSYLLGKSRTIVVHEIVRGRWTWCTAWSPDGTKLAIATETHHLAIVSTVGSPVWRVTHDKRIVGPGKKDTTHSIRSIAWGRRFIAIGGTGNAVSILAPVEPYPIIHRIKGTGFVGSLDWRIDSTILAIGSRCNKAMIVALSARDDQGRQPESQILETIARKNWVNAVAFSPGGLFFALGDAGGQLSIFRWVARSGMRPLTSFQMEDSILALSFSPDGKWLYAGGEDMRVTIISSNHWEIVHRIRKNRWVQCVAASKGGTHLCCGGVSSEVSILSVGLGWDNVINIELKGLVPLSACWHPRDQFLALTGQSGSVLVVETTNARHVADHFLRSISPVLALDFSPDSRHAVIGNQQGVITFFKLRGAAFVVAYEMVVAIGDDLCIRWSPDGSFIAIGSQNLLLIVGRHEAGGARPSIPDSASGFSIIKVMRGMGDIKGIAINKRSRYVVPCGTKMEVLDVLRSYKNIRSFERAVVEASAWSTDGRWLAVLGQNKNLTIYNTDFDDCDKWHPVASIEMMHPGSTVAFGPASGSGLVYVAFGGNDECVTVVEIRTREGTWETVLRAHRDGVIYDLDWNLDGLLAAAIGNGTVSIIDLSYLRAGLAVSEMDYKAQLQALTSVTEIRRNRGRNRMTTARWIPRNAEGGPTMLAVGGTDGEVEIIDLTSHERCEGYSAS